MNIKQSLIGMGIIGLVILILLVLIFIFIAPFIIMSFVASYFGLTGIVWWAVVIVGWFIIAGIINKLST